MKQFIIILIGCLLFSCGNEQQQNFILKGEVKGLKKGFVYLQRQQDSIMITLDSLEINGSSTFALHAELSEPEMLFLTLDKNDDDTGSVVFFASAGTTEIKSTLKNFNYDATIKGSKQQETLEKYLAVMSKFNDENLELLEKSLKAQTTNKTNNFSFESDFNKLLKRKYLYTINFAINHPDSEVSPYLAISEISNTSISFLQQIYDALTDDIKSSKYGVDLKNLIEARKAQ